MVSTRHWLLPKISRRPVPVVTVIDAVPWKHVALCQALTITHAWLYFQCRFCFADSLKEEGPRYDTFSCFLQECCSLTMAQVLCHPGWLRACWLCYLEELRGRVEDRVKCACLLVGLRRLCCRGEALLGCCWRWNPTCCWTALTMWCWSQRRSGDGSGLCAVCIRDRLDQCFIR